MNRKAEALLAKLEKSAADDHIGLWEVIRNVRREFQPQTDDVKQVTLKFVSLMLSHGFVAGVSRGETFERWPDQRVQIILDRIEREWIEPGPEPTLGDIVWFDLRTSEST